MQETAPLLDDSQLGGETRSQSATTTKVPEVEIHLCLTEGGPIHVFKWNLGGEEQDHLEVRPIFEKYGLETIYAYTVDNARGGVVHVPIKFDPTSARSLLTFRDGTVVHIIGIKHKNPVIEAIKNIVLATVFGTLLKMFLLWITPDSIPPWVAVCIIIVVSFGRKSSRDLFKDLFREFGWQYHRS
ncbi:unnamed protein product [Eruca vesicaria subsp. sativa]|uniref:Uncharacterized protein n=1 Tax=Eruca vesicaria subsp. sativa TaxID=29727 RepID=A0ABC8KLA1_ERUVS|nr:unnamed protein product [Eruca vesicaria subsp. sativa]